MQQVKSRANLVKIIVITAGLLASVAFSVLGEYEGISNQFLKVLITILSMIPFFVYLAFASLTNNYVGSIIIGWTLLGISLIGHGVFLWLADLGLKPWVYILFSVCIIFVIFPIGYYIGMPLNENLGRNEKLNRIKNKRSLKFGN